METYRLDRVEEWSTGEVEKWLYDKGFAKYRVLFCDHHQIDGKALLNISEADLKNPPLSIPILGDIKHLMIEIHELQCHNLPSLPNVSSGSDDIMNYQMLNLHNTARLRKRRHLHSSDSSDRNTIGSDADIHEGSAASSVRLKPELWKTAVGMLYFLTVTWITAIVMVFVHNRVPDMQLYPPLPDIFLDNVPLIPWAFTMCEFTGIILFSIWVGILLIHKHRFILLRRMCSLFGSVFLLRCITMIITSLSVPGRHIECKARSYNEWWEKLSAAFFIWLGGGMSIQGVRTCGDYMFSGHTVALTLLNFFITEYTPRKLYFLHTFTWVLNLFGIFFILAGHEHYSIDVFIAFYISTRLFLYYHTLANNRALMQGDRRRTRIWFPLFYFFESGVDGIVPNEYEWPFGIPKKFKQIIPNTFS